MSSSSSPTSNNGVPISSPSKQPAPRSESFAYPPTNTTFAKLSLFARQHTRAVLVAIIVTLLVLLITLDQLPSAGNSEYSYLRRSSLAFAVTHWGGAIRNGYFKASEAVKVPAGKEFRFAAVTDLDEFSRVVDAKKPEFYATLLSGVVTKKPNGRYDLSLYETTSSKVPPRTLLTQHNEAGRGGEFSELVLYQDRLLTFDDRTGDVFEILNKDQGTDSFCVPRFVITEGSGETDKGMKWEWATVKDGLLYMGSMGKEYTLQDGTVKNRNNLWIATLNERGELVRQDWTMQYTLVRDALGASFPGYLIIEAVRWSDILKKWVFLPRRISHDAYDENEDERKGGHKVVLVDAKFTTKPQVVDLKMDSLDPLKGFSTFAFIPNSNDEHVLAVRSVEENCVDFTSDCSQRSYFLILDITTGEQLSEEVQVHAHGKYEGVEFVDLKTVPPPVRAGSA